MEVGLVEPTPGSSLGPVQGLNRHPGLGTCQDHGHTRCPQPEPQLDTAEAPGGGDLRVSGGGDPQWLQPASPRASVSDGWTSAPAPPPPDSAAGAGL